MRVARAKNQQRLLGLIESVLNGQQTSAMTLAVLMQPFAAGWDRQRTTGSGSSVFRIE